MQTALETLFLSVDDYLSTEEARETRHEYVAGVVYPMADVTDSHNTLAGNLAAALHHHLRSGPCRAYISDVKVRLFLAGKHLFYYPDVMVTCDPRDTNAYYKEFPKVIVEVLSEATERTDRREKFWNYTQIDSVEEYILISQDRMELTMFRRSQDWKPEILREPGQEMKVGSLQFTTRLGAIYEGATPG